MINTFKDAHLLAMNRKNRKLVEPGIKKWWNRGRVDDYVKQNADSPIRSIWVSSSEVVVELERS